jgi:hypothetical protein
LLAGRYRIAELLAEIDGARVWRAVDEVLSRAVVVDVLPVGDPRTNLLFDAARRAAAANDPRFLRVLDCDMHDGVTYCVREWAGGRTLERMLSTGPLTGQQAGWLAREVSEALENLHRTGYAHGAISPATVVVTDAGAIKVVGVATEAALRSSGPGSPEEDVRALGELLFASLTGRWPGPAPAWGLQPAPVEHGRLLSPRQVRAGVPRSLDDISDRLLGNPPRHHAPPITSAAGLSAALSGVVGSSHEPPNQMDETVQVARQNGSIDDATQVVPQAPPPAIDPTPQPTYTPEANGYGQPQPAYEGGYNPATDTRPVRRRPNPPNGNGRRRDEPKPKPKGSWGGRILILLAILALLSVIAMAQFLLKGAMNNDQNAGDDGGVKSSAPPQTSTTPSATGGAVKIVKGTDFDPKPAGSGSEHPEDVPNTYDGKASTTWDTQSYTRPNLGGQKPGVGIYYDLGAPTAVSKVQVTLEGDGTSLELLIPKGDTSTAPTTISGWQPVATQEDQPEGTVTLAPQSPTETRYVLVWLTKLPKEDKGGKYRGTISEVAIQK